MVMSATVLATKIGAVLTTYGRNITVASSVDSYDPATGTNTPTLTSHTVRSSPPYAYARQFVDGNTIREGDVRYIFSGDGLTFTPAQGQKITDSTRVYRIVGVQTHSYDAGGSTFTAYEVQARGDG